MRLPNWRQDRADLAGGASACEKCSRMRRVENWRAVVFGNPGRIGCPADHGQRRYEHGRTFRRNRGAWAAQGRFARREEIAEFTPANVEAGSRRLFIFSRSNSRDAWCAARLVRSGSL